MKRFSEFINEDDDDPRTQIKIYCDLDGVLADFDRGAKELAGVEESDSDEVRWSKIEKVDHFYLKLKKTPEANQLWNHIKKFKPSILTSVPKSFPKQAASDKVDWVMKNFDYYNEILTVRGKQQKAKWAVINSPNLLIDDRQEVLDYWKEAGGIGILHKNVENTIENLQQFGFS